MIKLYCSRVSCEFRPRLPVKRLFVRVGTCPIVDVKRRIKQTQKRVFHGRCYRRLDFRIATGERRTAREQHRQGHETLSPILASLDHLEIPSLVVFAHLGFQEFLIVHESIRAGKLGRLFGARQKE